MSLTTTFLAWLFASALPPHAHSIPCHRTPVAEASAALANDNRSPAGTLANGILTVRLVARPATWHPEGGKNCGIRVHAFAEEGKPAYIPGPLIRVRAGTEVRMILRNELGQNLSIRGLFDRTIAAASAGNELRASVQAGARDIPAGGVREIRFRATRPGTFYYWGWSEVDTLLAFPNRPPGVRMPLFSPLEDSQLVGALIVDPPEGSPPDRVFVITHWVLPELPGSTPRPQLNALNGLSWPYSENVDAAVGDTLRWRVLNPGNVPHTMHLHGFYFRVASRGGAAWDSIYAPDEQPFLVSEFMEAGRTAVMQWIPERAGNWLFHCHFVAHMSPKQRLDQIFGARNAAPPAEHAGHANHTMAGLIMGVTVRSRSASLVKSNEVAWRSLRLFANERAGVFEQHPGLGFVLQEGGNAPAADSIRIPGSPIILARGEPTQITVINRLRIPLAVHWHGIELESYYDGVPDFSGAPGSTAPAIMPGDSFTVYMTPPRAGTFMYHIHSEQAHELNAGLYGPLIVLEPGQKWDPNTDQILVLSDAGPTDESELPGVFVNGTQNPAPITMTAGVAHRLRIIGIRANGRHRVQITGSPVPLSWRAIARDGADVPRHQIRSEAAHAEIAVGTITDYEFTPVTPGNLILQVDPFRLGTIVQNASVKVPLRVRSP